MANQKLQVGRALAVLPNDSVNIPFPDVITSGAVTAIAPYRLIDAAAAFITNGVTIGSIVLNAINPNAGATVSRVVSETELELSFDIFTNPGEAFSVYFGDNDNGCVLYVGTGGDVAVITVGGDNVVFKNLASGQFVPVQVLRVKSTDTTASDIIALW
ncbi:MAG: hypothetical protein [Podoviridae sp. ctrTa16]|nr:MAG: hypothetical protein [Podoviridae sp. ctrTa16]